MGLGFIGLSFFWGGLNLGFRVWGIGFGFRVANRRIQKRSILAPTSLLVFCPSTRAAVSTDTGATTTVLIVGPPIVRRPCVEFSVYAARS